MSSPAPLGPASPVGLAVLYGSQTGNAMEIAKTIDAEAVKRGFNSRVAALNDFGLVRLRAPFLTEDVCCTSQRCKPRTQNLSAHSSSVATAPFVG